MIDASIMPIITTDNLNVPTIMIAEKIADLIRGCAPLPRINVPYYIAGNTPARRQGKQLRQQPGLNKNATVSDRVFIAQLL